MAPAVACLISPADLALRQAEVVEGARRTAAVTQLPVEIECAYEVVVRLGDGSTATNAGSEGTNRVIKTIARDAHGFRNPENQRLRTRTATTRRHRGHLNPT
ncbi:hypothetical protein GCM10022225_74070 [Plantactinospora mayteni]|uniref:Transposase IS204/IS1001/IS1096/IS1165 DDE domain-containing protein n=1 Tax=Plantactinospora mayteni TaxID=566021 RepID=A0ABQ4EW95_9ACTN|nr:hypothetical protein Pma05_55080 [Plantactinospora mayteni]